MAVRLDIVVNIMLAILEFLAFIVVSICVLYAVLEIGSWFLITFQRLRPRIQFMIDHAHEAVPFIKPPAPQVLPQTPFEQAQLIQPRRNGRTIWQPIPTTDITAYAPMSEEWISTTIEAPRIIRQGRTLVLRVEVSNSHSSKSLADNGMLEVEYPSSASQVLGSERIMLQPNGDTTLIYFKWAVPYLPGNYVLRFQLLNLQAKTEKAIVIK